MIRAVRPADLAALASLRGSATHTEVTALTSPHASGHTGSAFLARVLLNSLTRPASRRGAWVYTERDRPAALVLTRCRLGGLAWDIERLLVAHQSERAAADLLGYVCERAAMEGARRVFLEVASESTGLEIASRAGFERYTSSKVYVAPASLPRLGLNGFEARPRKARDNFNLFHLYNGTVPSRVRSAEALTFDEWLALFPAPPPLLPSAVTNKRHLVWELGSELVGWAALTQGEGGQFAEMLINPKYAEGMGSLLAHLVQCSNQGVALYVKARDYQTPLAQALEQAGFRPVAESHVLVRHLAVRLPEARLVPANLAGS